MNIFNFLFRTKLRFGEQILPDIRTQTEKDKDYKTEELIVSTQPLIWEDWGVWRQRPQNIKQLADIKVANQRQTSSCGAFAAALLLAINNYLEEKQFIEMSPAPIYARRSNKPQLGMYMHDIGNICIKYGAIPEVLYPTNTTSDATMSDISNLLPSFNEVGKLYKADAYFWVKTNLIDNVARLLSLNLPVLIAVKFGEGEWDNLAVPILKETEAIYGHALTAIPQGFFNYQGKKAILLQDSWGTGIAFQGRRILTEDWFSSGRVFHGLWFNDINNLEVFNSSISRPKYTFKRNLQIGDVGSDVSMLQRCLGYLRDDEGYLFPLFQPPTGNYYGITRNAVQRFQKKYNLPITGIVDDLTRGKLNEVFK